LLHIDAYSAPKSLAPGHRVTGDRDKNNRARSLGKTVIIAVQDDHSRMVYAELHSSENAANVSITLTRAAEWMRDQGCAPIEAVMSDNAKAYTGHQFAHTLTQLGARHIRIPPTPRAGTASSSGSSAPSKTNGPTAASGPTPPPATAPCHRGCATTTATDRTPPPAADHPTPASTKTASRTARVRRGWTGAPGRALCCHSSAGCHKRNRGNGPLTSCASPYALRRPAALALAPASAHAARKAPAGFLGANVDGPMLDEGFPLAREVRQMVRSGVETARVAVYWSDAQPYASVRGLSASRARGMDLEGGVPTDWRPTDRIIGALARRGIRVLATVLRAPSWAARAPHSLASPPTDAGAYARFVAALARRYGPGGELWRLRPSRGVVPVRDWQVWNEQNNAGLFWRDQPFVTDYVALVRTTRAAVRAVDPVARIVLGGMVGGSTADLEAFYRAGGGGLVDAVDIHPFTLYVDNVIVLLRGFRAVMRANGDGDAPLMISELSWPSGLGRTTQRYGYETTPRGQAQRLTAALARLVALRAELRLDQVDWYTWLTEDTGDEPFGYAGLRVWRGRRSLAKPAWQAFRRAARRYEGCTKAATATKCRLGGQAGRPQGATVRRRERARGRSAVRRA
jgi:hypothetical protein